MTEQTFLDQLRESAKQSGSIVCMGLDPDLEAMPEMFAREGIKEVPLYFLSLFQEIKNQHVGVGAFKPNAGFYLKHDRPREGNFSGSVALANVMRSIKFNFPGIPIILDFKRGDIAKSSANYAVEGFDCWGADAITISPYFGTDSVTPFFRKGKGTYILNRTSNPGATDLQNLLTLSNPEEFARVLETNLRNFYEEATGHGISVPSEEVYAKWIAACDTDNFISKGIRETITKTLKESGKEVYVEVARKIREWAEGNPGVGAVVGATSLQELDDLTGFYAGRNVALLIPGVGGQGGKADEVTAVLRKHNYDLSLARINSSSGLTHPWKKRENLEKMLKETGKTYAQICVDEIRKLNEQIDYKAS